MNSLILSSGTKFDNLAAQILNLNGKIDNQTKHIMDIKKTLIKGIIRSNLIISNYNVDFNVENEES